MRICCVGALSELADGRGGALVGGRKRTMSSVPGGGFVVDFARVDDIVLETVGGTLAVVVRDVAIGVAVRAAVGETAGPEFCVGARPTVGPEFCVGTRPTVGPEPWVGTRDTVGPGVGVRPTVGPEAGVGARGIDGIWPGGALPGVPDDCGPDPACGVAHGVPVWLGVRVPPCDGARMAPELPVRRFVGASRFWRNVGELDGVSARGDRGGAPSSRALHDARA